MSTGGFQTVSSPRVEQQATLASRSALSTALLLALAQLVILLSLRSWFNGHARVRLNVVVRIVPKLMALGSMVLSKNSDMGYCVIDPTVSQSNGLIAAALVWGSVFHMVGYPGGLVLPLSLAC